MSTDDIRYGTIFLGAFLHAPALGKLEVFESAYCVVSNKDGRIEEFGSGRVPEKKGYKVHRLNPDQFFIPGFLDTHTHAPQYRNAGVGMDYELLEWLDKVTFPEESSFTQSANESADLHRERIAELYSKMVLDYLQ